MSLACPLFPSPLLGCCRVSVSIRTFFGSETQQNPTAASLPVSACLELRLLARSFAGSCKGALLGGLFGKPTQHCTGSRCRMVSFEKILQVSDGRWQVWQDTVHFSFMFPAGYGTLCYSKPGDRGHEQDAGKVNPCGSVAGYSHCEVVARGSCGKPVTCTGISRVGPAEGRMFRERCVVARLQMILFGKQPEKYPFQEDHRQPLFEIFASANIRRYFRLWV